MISAAHRYGLGVAAGACVALSPLARPADAQKVPTRAEIAAPPAMVTGKVLGPDEKALEDAEVLLGDTLKNATDRKGRFAFDPVAPGVHEVLVRKIGFVPIRFRLAVTAGDLWEGTITMDRAAQALPEVVVIESSKVMKNFRPTWLDGFLDRRRMGLGSYFDRVDIENSHIRRLAYLLARVPGITVREGPGYDQVTTRRCDAGLAQAKSVLWVDGLKVETSYTGRFHILSEYLPEQVWAVEVYRGRSSVPSRFDDAQACLTILLWTNSR
ncbi:MAG: hypothetical protein C0497_05245 [Gemmatimonas sp.]|nr:hypothetical protein [Gemmatimonas sp.]